MLRCRLLLWLAALAGLAVQPSLAATVQVGTCNPRLASYPTISQAVTGVNSGGTIDVCPGTYAEQLTITKNLTLQGVASGTADQAVITVPSGGLVANAVSVFGESVAAQIAVEGASVTINNLTVDGTGGDMGCTANTWLAGIFYGSTSAGMVNHVRASGQVNGLCGVGIWAENSDTSNPTTVTIQNSSVYNVDSTGIFAGTGPLGTSPTLTANVTNNVVNASAAVSDIQPDSVGGKVNGNNIGNASFGVYNLSPIGVASNTIFASTYGVYLANGGAATNNDVDGANIGVLIGASGATVTGNHLVSSAIEGIELGCYATTVSGNLINDAPIGVDAVPSAGIGSNTFFNTATTQTGGCAVAAVAALGVRANLQQRSQPRVTISRQEWHTPSTPFGTRTK